MSDDTLMRLLIQRVDEISRDQKAMAEAIRQSELSASDSRRRMHERMDKHTELLLDISPRVASLEHSVEVQAPTLEEYRTLKAKALGAGSLGKALWRMGAWLIGAAAALIALRHDIADFLRWLMSR